MNEKSREIESNIIKKNCENCCHIELCKYTEDFNNAVSRIIYQAHVDGSLLSISIKCKHHMYTGGTTYKFDSDL